MTTDGGRAAGARPDHGALVTCVVGRRAKGQPLVAAGPTRIKFGDRTFLRPGRLAQP